MSVEAVRRFLAEHGLADAYRSFETSSATVELAAAALRTDPARIAKTISLYGDDGCLLILAAGDVKIDNAKFKAQFGRKAKMLAPEDVEPLTGHAPGGVCPFANPAGARVYLDVSLRRFDAVYPACGSPNSAVKLTPEELELLSGGEWCDLCKLPEPAAE